MLAIGRMKTSENIWLLGADKRPRVEVVLRVCYGETVVP
jgi:hypothetical protein